MRTFTRSLLTLAAALACWNSAHADDGALWVQVSNPAGQPIPGVVLSTSGPGSTSPPTAENGLTRLVLGVDTKPGREVELIIVRAPRNLIFISPWHQYVTVPCFENNPQCRSKVVLAERGSRMLLENPEAVLAMCLNVNEKFVRTSFGKPAIDERSIANEAMTEEQKLATLERVAKKFGFPSEQIDRAIRAFSERPGNSFQRGQFDLYKSNYPEAVRNLLQAKAESKRDLERAERNYVDVVLSLGRAQFGNGEYTEAVSNFREAAGRRPDDAGILHDLGRAFQEVGDYASAEKYLKGAADIYRKEAATDPSDVIGPLVNLSNLYRVQGEYEKAGQALKEVVSVNEKRLGAGHPDVALALSLLANLYTEEKRYTEAEALYKKALAVWEKHPEPESANWIGSLLGLGKINVNRGNFDEAEKLYKRIIAIEEKQIKSEPPQLVSSIGQVALAAIYVLEERPKDAEALYKQALAAQEKQFGPGHPRVLPALGYLIQLYFKDDRYAEAEPLLARARVIYEKSHGTELVDAAGLLAMQAFVYHEQGKRSEAEQLYKRALEIYEKNLGPVHGSSTTAGNYAATLDKYIDLLRGAKRDAEVGPLLRRAVAAHEGKFEPGHPGLAVGLGDLAAIHMGLGDAAGAEPLFRRALAAYEENLGPKRKALWLLPQYGETLGKYAELLNDAKRGAELDPLLRRALAVYNANLGPGHAELVSMVAPLVNLYVGLRKYAEAEAVVKEGLTTAEQRLGREHTGVASILNSYAHVLYMTNRMAEQEPLLKRALAIYERGLGRDQETPALPEQYADTVTSYADVLRRTKRGAEAGTLLRRALSVSEEKLGRENPKLAPVLRELASAYSRQGEYGDAEPLLKRALALYVENIGTAYVGIEGGYSGVAEEYIRALSTLKRTAEAEPLLKRALAAYEKLLGPDHQRVADACLPLASVYLDQSKYAEAEPLLKRALTIYEVDLAANYIDAVEMYSKLLRGAKRGAEMRVLFGRVLAAFEDRLKPGDEVDAGILRTIVASQLVADDNPEAETLAKQGVALVEKKLGAGHALAADMLWDYADWLQRRDRDSEAASLRQRALTIYEEKLGPDDVRTAERREALIDLYLSQEKYTEAEPLLKRVWAGYENNPGQEDRARLEQYATVLISLNRGAEAEPVLRRALAALESDLGPDSPSLLFYLDGYAALLRKGNRTDAAAQIEARAKAIRAK